MTEINPNNQNLNQPKPLSPEPKPAIESGPTTQPKVPPSAPTTTVSPEPKKSTTTPDIVSEPIDRRTFIKWSTVGWAAFAAVAAGYGTMIMRYLFPNVLFEPKQTFRAGFPDDYQTGEVSVRWKDKHGVWIVRETDQIYALSTVCTHLGCTPNWLADENKFKCPCHGSGFYKSGIHFEGPAPRPLERFRIYLADDGQIVVDKTRKYQQEKGEWKDPESYLLV